MTRGRRTQQPDGRRGVGDPDLVARRVGMGLGVKRARLVFELGPNLRGQELRDAIAMSMAWAAVRQLASRFGLSRLA